jgi:hypothetical protein
MERARTEVSPSAALEYNWRAMIFQVFSFISLGWSRELSWLICSSELRFGLRPLKVSVSVRDHA